MGTSMIRTAFLSLAIGASSGILILAACASNPVTNPGEESGTCPEGIAYFTVPPIALNDVVGWVPLGNLNPPAHTFPTDHQYLYHTNPNGGTPHVVNVVSPGKITITGARRSTFHHDNHSDYSLDFAVCKDVHGNFGHIATLDAAITSSLGEFTVGCSTYSPDPNTTVTQCSTPPVQIVLQAGAAIGTSGGTPGLYGFDFTLWDRRATPLHFANLSRWSIPDQKYVVPASDYFAEPAKSAIAAKLGSGDGTQHRTIPPLGGTIGIDIDGSAQGNWFIAGQPTYPESPHLAISPDNVHPDRIGFSVGTSLTGFGPGSFVYTPSNGSAVNKSAAEIPADGQVYCVEFSGGRVILLQLMNASTLHIEGRSGGKTCANQTPLTFSSAMVEFVR